jgi:hypothetical protein
LTDSLHKSKVKNKSIPVTGRGCLRDCLTLMIPLCLNSRLTDGDVGLTHWRRLTPQENCYFCLWYLFLFKTEQTRSIK